MSSVTKPVDYVNVRGDSIDPSALPRAAPKLKGPPLKRVIDPAKAKQHFGFEVVGVRADSLSQAIADHEASRQKAALDGKPALAAFDESAWLGKQEPRRAIPRVFSICESAEQAAGMVRAGGGWLRVQVVEILKG